MMDRVTTATTMASFLFLHNRGGQILKANWVVQQNFLEEGRRNPEPFTTSSASGNGDRGVAVSS